jgi:thiaminase
MLRNITLSADEQLISRAREKAVAAQSTLNVEFRKWLQTYAGTQDEAAVNRFRDVMTQLANLDAGRSFTRDEMNERQP